MKNPSLLLVIGIPALSLLMSAVMLYFALQAPVRETSGNALPLSKTSWQITDDQDDR